MADFIRLLSVSFLLEIILYVTFVNYKPLQL